MKKLLLLLMLLPNIAIASDPSGLVYVLLYQFVIFIWPIILPFFFLGSAIEKFKSYLVLLIAIYGVIGLVSLPLTFFLYLLPSDTEAMMYITLTALQVIAFVTSVYILRHFNVKLCQIVNPSNS